MVVGTVEKLSLAGLVFFADMPRNSAVKGIGIYRRLYCRFVFDVFRRIVKKLPNGLIADSRRWLI